MATNESEFRSEQPRSTFGTWIAVVLLFCLFALVVWVVMGLMPRGDNYEQKRSEARREKLKTANEDFQTALHTYGWVDKEKGVVRVPIERGMQLAVTELAQRKPAPANPIEGGAGEKAGMQVTAPVAPSPAPVAAPADPGSTPKATAVSGPDSENRAQPAAAANPPNAAPATQPGPQATAAASPPAPSGQPAKPDAERAATPVQTAPGPALPVPGRDPMGTPSPAPQQP